MAYETSESKNQEVTSSGFDKRYWVSTSPHEDRNEQNEPAISFTHKGQLIDTGVIKFGALVGDRARIGANAVIAPGAILAPATIVSRLALIDQRAR